MNVWLLSSGKAEQLVTMISTCDSPSRLSFELNTVLGQSNLNVYRGISVRQIAVEDAIKITRNGTEDRREEGQCEHDLYLRNQSIIPSMMSTIVV